MILDPAVADLLAAIANALEGAPDWHAVAVTHAANRVLLGDDPGAAADWLREFLAQRAEHERHLTDGRWHDDCRSCLRRRERGGTGLPAEQAATR
jgi:hypothetical protein